MNREEISGPVFLLELERGRDRTSIDRAVAMSDLNACKSGIRSVLGIRFFMGSKPSLLTKFLERRRTSFWRICRVWATDSDMT